MLPKFFINRPVFACVISIIIVIAGLISLKSLPMEEYPQLTPPQVVVSATYTGADAKTVADTVATPLEDAINGVEDMIYMQSTSSSSGSMTLNVYFDIGTDPQTATVNVNNRVKTAESKLPEEVKRLGVNVREKSSAILEVVSFYDPEKSMDIIDLNNYININVINELKKIPGVGDASIVGLKDYSMRIWMKPDMLNKYGLAINDVTSAIKEQNSQYAAGKLAEQPASKDNPYVYVLKPQGRLVKIKDFENIIIRTDEKGSILRLKDIADVQLGASDYNFRGKLNQFENVPVLIFLQSGANALATVDAVNAKIKELSKNFPGALTFVPSYDTTTFVKISIEEVVHTFIEALVLVAVVMFLFLGNLRSTIIPMIAVPVSIIGTFAGFYVAGFSINLITLFALILAIGIVVDDAIVVVENVERILHEEPNLSVKEATEKAMSEIVAPVISIVLVLCAVFVPVSFMEGFVGVIQRQFALTLVISVIISGLVALTLTPALCALMLTKKHSEPLFFIRWFNNLFDKCTSFFTAGVASILRHVIPSLIVVGIMIFAIVSMFKVFPSGLVPAEDKGSVMAFGQLPAASSLDRTEEFANEVIGTLLKDKNTKYVTTLIGYDMMAGTLKENSLAMFTSFIPWDERKGEANSSFAFANKYNRALYLNRKGLVFMMNPPPIMGLSLTEGFELFAQNTSGKSYEEIQKDMDRLMQIVSKRKDLTTVRTTLDTRFPQYDLSLNVEKAKMANVAISDVYSAMSSLIGQYYVNDFNMLGKTFKVYMRAKSNFRDSPDDLNKIFVRSKDGKMLPLSSLVTLKRSLGPTIVDRFNGFPAAKLTGAPAPGYTSGDAIKAISEIFAKEFKDYSIGWVGTSYQEVKSSGKGSLAFVFGLIFVYLILAAQYERWIMPIAVLTAVPFSVFGAILFALFSGMSNDIYFQIGLILLIGLGAKNAILIVEFAMAEVKAGKSPFDAAVDAARLRFRPIVMTSFAFILGVLPMVLSTGAGAASRHSLGTGVIGGMLAASTIAIFFIPMFFCLVEGLDLWIEKKKNKKDIKEDKNVL